MTKRAFTMMILTGIVLGLILGALMIWLAGAPWWILALTAPLGPLVLGGLLIVMLTLAWAGGGYH